MTTGLARLRDDGRQAANEMVKERREEIKEMAL